MKSSAIYPGTFDPITYGHIDVIKKSLKIFDKVIVAAAENINKDYLYNWWKSWNYKRLAFKDLKLNKNRILVIPFNTLTINLCNKYKAGVIIRGLRAVSDFEYEFQLAGMNKKLNEKIETIFMMSDVENQIISSKFVKEIAKLDGKIDKFLTKSIVKKLKNKLELKNYLF